MADRRRKKPQAPSDKKLDPTLNERATQAFELLTGLTLAQLQLKISELRANGYEVAAIEIPSLKFNGIPLRMTNVPNLRIVASKRQAKAYAPDDAGYNGSHERPGGSTSREPTKEN